MHSDFENSSEITFKTIVTVLRGSFRYLVTKWKILCTFTIIGGLFGVIFVWIQKPKFEAILTFSTEEERSAGVGSIAGLAAQFGLDIGGTSNVFAGDNLLQLIKSRKIMWAALLDTVAINGKQQSLLNFYLNSTNTETNASKDGGLKKITFPNGQDPLTFSRDQDSILLNITNSLAKNSISAEKPDKKTDIFAVTCLSDNETFCKLIVEKLVQKVSDFYIENKTTRSKQIVSILQKKADSLKNAFSAALLGRANLVDENVNPAFQSPLVSVQRKQADITILSSAYSEIVKNLEIAKFNLLKETPLITIIDQPVLPLKNLKSSRLAMGLVVGFIFLIVSSVYLLLRKRIKGAF